MGKNLIKICLEKTSDVTNKPTVFSFRFIPAKFPLLTTETEPFHLPYKTQISSRLYSN